MNPPNETFVIEVEDASKLTDKELLDLMQRRDNPLSKAWFTFRDESARISQACEQAKPPGIMEIRRMELDAAIKIMRAAGVGIRMEPTPQRRKH